MVVDGDDPLADQDTRSSLIRERVATWATSAALLAFFIVTIALWGYAAWWCVAKLIDLIF